MEATRKQIEVTKEVRAEIKKAFKCSDMTLWRALNFSNDTPTSLRIRKFAKQKGGVLLLLTPATETIHDADGICASISRTVPCWRPTKALARYKCLTRTATCAAR